MLTISQRKGKVTYIVVSLIMFLMLFSLLSIKVSAESPTKSLDDVAIWIDYVNISTVYDFYDGYAVIKNKDDKYGLIDVNGNLVISFMYDGMGHHSDGLIKVIKTVHGEYWYSYINPAGEEIIPEEFTPSFLKINGEGYMLDNQFKEGLAYVRKKDVFGFMDKEGNMKITFDGNMVAGSDRPIFSEGLSVVFNNQKYGYINKQGEVVIPFQFDSAGAFQDGYAAVLLDGKGEIIDKEGNVVNDAVPEGVSRFQEGYGTIESRTESTKNCYTLTGKESIELGCISNQLIGIATPTFSDGLIRMELQKNKTIYYNSSGQVVLETETGIRGGVFHEGLASFNSDEGVGFMDKNGEIVFAPTELIRGRHGSSLGVDEFYFHDGFAVVKHTFRGFGIIENPIARAKKLAEEEASRQQAEVEAAAKLKAEEEAQQLAMEEARQREEAAGVKMQSEIAESVEPAATQAVNVKQVSVKERGSTIPLTMGVVFLVLIVSGAAFYYTKMRRK